MNVRTVKVSVPTRDRVADCNHEWNHSACYASIEIKSCLSFNEIISVITCQTSLANRLVDRIGKKINWRAVRNWHHGMAETLSRSSGDVLNSGAWNGQSLMVATINFHYNKFHLIFSHFERSFCDVRVAEHEFSWRLFHIVIPWCRCRMALNTKCIKTFWWGEKAQIPSETETLVNVEMDR